MWGRPQGLKWWSTGSQGAVQRGTCLSEHFGIHEGPRKGSPLKTLRGRHAGWGPGALCPELHVEALDTRREFPPWFNSSLCTCPSSPVYFIVGLSQESLWFLSAPIRWKVRFLYLHLTSVGFRHMRSVIWSTDIHGWHYPQGYTWNVRFWSTEGFVLMVICPQADFTFASEIPEVLLIPSSTVPNSPVRFLPFLTISRLGPQIPLAQVHASHTIHPTIHSWSHSSPWFPLYPPSLTHLSLIHPSIHPPSTYPNIHLLYSTTKFKFLASRNVVWYFSYYPTETKYTHHILTILLLLLN